jgi:hypothetical protein
MRELLGPSPTHPFLTKFLLALSKRRTDSSWNLKSHYTIYASKWHTEDEFSVNETGHTSWQLFKGQTKIGSIFADDKTGEIQFYPDDSSTFKDIVDVSICLGVEGGLRFSARHLPFPLPRLSSDDITEEQSAAVKEYLSYCYREEDRREVAESYPLEYDEWAQEEERRERAEDIVRKDPKFS